MTRWSSGIGHSVTESQTLGHAVTLSRRHAVMKKPVTQSLSHQSWVTLSRRHAVMGKAGHSVTQSPKLSHAVMGKLSTSLPARFCTKYDTILPDENRK